MQHSPLIRTLIEDDKSKWAQVFAWLLHFIIILAVSCCSTPFRIKQLTYTEEQTVPFLHDPFLEGFSRHIAVHGKEIMSHDADEALNFKADHGSPPLLLQLCFLTCWTSSSAVTCHPHPQSSGAELQAGQMHSPPCWATARPRRDKHTKKDLSHHRKIISGHGILLHIRVYWNSDKAKPFLFVFSALCGEWNYSLQH